MCFVRSLLFQMLFLFLQAFYGKEYSRNNQVAYFRKCPQKSDFNVSAIYLFEKKIFCYLLSNILVISKDIIIN